jgi:hypothetical protein
VRPGSAVLWRHVVDDLSDALETALKLSAPVRRSQFTAAYDAATLERSVTRAVALLTHAKAVQRRRKRR